jgi:hypothetical protein
MFRILGIRVCGLGLKMKGSGCRVQSSELRVQGLVFRSWELGTTVVYGVRGLRFYEALGQLGSKTIPRARPSLAGLRPYRFRGEELPSYSPSVASPAAAALPWPYPLRFRG